MNDPNLICKICGHHGDDHFFRQPVMCTKCSDQDCQDGPDGETHRRRSQGALPCCGSTGIEHLSHCPLVSDNGRVVGVPDTVTHEQYMAAIRLLGIDPERIMSMHFHHDMIICSAVVPDEQGNPTLGVNDEVLTRPVVVRVVGDPS